MCQNDTTSLADSVTTQSPIDHIVVSSPETINMYNVVIKLVDICVIQYYCSCLTFFKSSLVSNKEFSSACSNNIQTEHQMYI